MIAGKNIAIYGLLAREDWLAASTYYVTQFFEIFDSTSSPSIASLSSILQLWVPGFFEIKTQYYITVFIKLGPGWQSLVATHKGHRTRSNTSRCHVFLISREILWCILAWLDIFITFLREFS